MCSVRVQRQIPSVAIQDPFVRTESVLRYIGKDCFGQQKQIGVSVVINTVRDGAFDTVLVRNLS